MAAKTVVWVPRTANSAATALVRFHIQRSDRTRSAVPGLYSSQPAPWRYCDFARHVGNQPALQYSVCAVSVSRSRL